MLGEGGEGRVGMRSWSSPCIEENNGGGGRARTLFNEPLPPPLIL